MTSPMNGVANPYVAITIATPILTLESPEVSKLLTSEYEAQLKQMNNPREALRIVTRVSIKEGVIHLTCSQGGDRYRFPTRAKLEALAATLNFSGLQSKQKELIQEIIKDVLAVPAHYALSLEIDPLPSSSSVDPWHLVYNADFNSYFQSRFCKIGNVVHKILHAQSINKELMCIQAEEISSPTVAEVRSALDYTAIIKMIDLALKKAAKNLSNKNLLFMRGPNNVSTTVFAIPRLNLFDDPELEIDDSPLVKIFEKALFENGVSAVAKGFQEKKNDKSESTDKKDGT